MPLAERLIFAACWLVAGSALTHGVHDLRGEAHRDRDRLRIEIGDSRSDRCLRLLNELQVRAEDGTRLAGTQDFDASNNRCRLEYPLPAEAGALTLRLLPRRRGPQRNERLVLAPVHDGAASGDTLVLTNRGKAVELPAGP